MATVILLLMLVSFDESAGGNLRPTDEREFVEGISGKVIPEPAGAKNPDNAPY